MQNRQSNKTSLDDISGAALASYEPKVGKKKIKKLKKAEREKNKGKDWFNISWNEKNRVKMPQYQQQSYGGYGHQQTGYGQQ